MEIKISIYFWVRPRISILVYSHCLIFQDQSLDKTTRRVNHVHSLWNRDVFRQWGQKEETKLIRNRWRKDREGRITNLGIFTVSGACPFLCIHICTSLLLGISISLIDVTTSQMAFLPLILLSLSLFYIQSIICTEIKTTFLIKLFYPLL